MRKLQMTLIAALAAGTVAMASERDLYNGYEMPPYQVVSATGGFELRQYAPHLLAEVTVSGTRSGAINRGFRELAGYIFGGNAEQQKIAMTVPVTQTQTGASWRVTFMMPEAWTQASLPKANSEAIRFVEAPASLQLVTQFSGLARDGVLAKQAAALKAEAAKRGLTVLGEPRFHFYDGPMTLPWQRRNEVALPVR